MSSLTLTKLEVKMSTVTFLNILRSLTVNFDPFKYVEKLTCQPWHSKMRNQNVNIDILELEKSKCQSWHQKWKVRMSTLNILRRQNINLDIFTKIWNINILTLTFSNNEKAELQSWEKNEKSTCQLWHKTNLEYHPWILAIIRQRDNLEI